MVNVVSLNNNKDYYHQSNVTQADVQKTNCVFESYDKNDNKVVDAADFGNNKFLTRLIRWALNRDWNEVGDSVLTFLNDIKADKDGFADYSNEQLCDAMEKMTKECDYRDGTNLVKVLNTLSKLATAFYVLEKEENRECSNYYNKKFYKNIFKDKYEKHSIYKDGGSLVFSLNDGTKILRYKSFKYNKTGWVIIKHPDGKIEVFDNKGNAVESSHDSDVRELCKEYKL